MQHVSRPVIAVTMGDPAGIGPETVVKAFAEAGLRTACRPLVVGAIAALERAMRTCQLDLVLNQVNEVSQCRFADGCIDVVEASAVDARGIQLGRVQAAAGRAAYDYIERATLLATSGEVSAITTAAINKQSLRAAGIPYIGHTEIFGSLTDVADPQTMFELGQLRIFFATRHVSLRQACTLITEDLVYQQIQRCAASLIQLSLAGGASAQLRARQGVLAVAALNPHAGDHGLLGREEIEAIEPAIARARAEGLQVEGPVPADSVFFLAQQGRYAAVLSLYHDQGHIAAKSIDHERTIALTLGLPFLRTSVDHGTAFDIAGTGQASAISMVEAIQAAARYTLP